MRPRDFRIGWRLLAREPAYSAVVVAGLAVGFAVCFLLLGFVRYCFTYDSGVPDAARVFVLQHKVNLMPQPTWTEFMPLPFQDAAVRSGLVLQSSAAIPRETIFVIGDIAVRDEVTAVDPAFAAMFGVTALEGDLDAALARPEGLVLTSSLARKLFGGLPALGRTVAAGDAALRVMAIVADAPANTTMPYTSLVGRNSTLWTAAARAATSAQWQGLGGKIYLRLRDGAAPEQVTRLLQDAADQSPWKAMAPTAADRKRLGHVIEVRLRALPDAYFDTEVAGAFRSGPRGERAAVLALAAVALLVLALAAANYLNLATVRTMRREREIGVRKAIGAGQGQLAGLLMAESVLVSALAYAAGVLLAWLLLPLFSELVNRRLEGLFSGAALFTGALCAIALGMATALYPAWIALRVRPLAVLTGRGEADAARGLWVRRVLTAGQFAAAIALTAVTLAIGWQTVFAIRLDPGFDSAPLSVLVLPRDTPDPARQAMRDELARLPGVAAVAASGSPIGAAGIIKGSIEIKPAGARQFPVKLQLVSANFFDVFRAPVLAGRLFDPAIDTAPPGSSQAAVIDMAAARALGFASAQAAIGGHFDDGRHTIVGVAGTVRDQSVREAIGPTVYLVDGRQNVLTLRTSASQPALRDQVEPLWKRRFPSHPLELRSVRSYFAENYADELRLAQILGAASLTAIAIAAFGIYVLAAYSAQRRGREIVIRKLHGARRRAIARLLGTEFAALVAAGAALGIPVAAVVNARYLAHFALRAPMGWWPLGLALLLAAVVALAATARHTLAAMRMRPARALRD